MVINRRFEEASEKIEAGSSTATETWVDIMPKLEGERVIPIISNSFRIEQIFREESEETNTPAEKSKLNIADDPLTISEQLTRLWAKKIKYPMADKHNLARVAQYLLVEADEPVAARKDYIDFLKFLLLTGSVDEKDDSKMEEKKKEENRIKSQIQTKSFSDIAYDLDYPRIPKEKDPLRLLAKLPIPIYITTSQSDFLERALEAEHKHPKTQVCFWFSSDESKLPKLAEKHEIEPGYKPITGNPLVYHLYGLEDYPQSLLLSEDDYVTFLINTLETGSTNTKNPIVPLSLRRAIAESNLVLLGFRLQDWDFRALFRFLVRWREEDFSPRGMAIQLREEEKRIEDVEKSIKYLGNYFKKKNFEIKWNSAESFIQELYADWKAYIQNKP